MIEVYHEEYFLILMLCGGWVWVIFRNYYSVIPHYG